MNNCQTLKSKRMKPKKDDPKNFENGYLAFERTYLNGEIIEEKIPSHSKKTE